LLFSHTSVQKQDLPHPKRLSAFIVHLSPTKGIRQRLPRLLHKHKIFDTIEVARRSAPILRRGFLNPKLFVPPYLTSQEDQIVTYHYTT